MFAKARRVAGQGQACRRIVPEPARASNFTSSLSARSETHVFRGLFLSQVFRAERRQVPGALVERLAARVAVDFPPEPIYNPGLFCRACDDRGRVAGLLERWGDNDVSR